MTPEIYRDWLKLLVDGNQNMVRVWGGGIYEDDSFYDACDGEIRAERREANSDLQPRTWHFGLARFHVWMWTGLIIHAIGVIRYLYLLFRVLQYPAYDSLCKSVKLEAEHNVKRLRHHPSIVVFGKWNQDV